MSFNYMKPYEASKLAMQVEVKYKFIFKGKPKKLLN